MCRMLQGDKCKRNKSHKHSLLAAGVDLEIDLAGVMIAKKEVHDAVTGTVQRWTNSRHRWTNVSTTSLKVRVVSCVDSKAY